MVSELAGEGAVPPQLPAPASHAVLCVCHRRSIRRGSLLRRQYINLATRFSYLQSPLKSSAIKTMTMNSNLQLSDSKLNFFVNVGKEVADASGEVIHNMSRVLFKSNQSSLRSRSVKYSSKVLVNPLFAGVNRHSRSRSAKRTSAELANPLSTAIIVPGADPWRARAQSSLVLDRWHRNSSRSRSVERTSTTLVNQLSFVDLVCMVSRSQNFDIIISTQPSNVCLNSDCKEASDWPRKGWRCLTGEFADLCNRCSYDYKENELCETFHLDFEALMKPYQPVRVNLLSLLYRKKIEGAILTVTAILNVPLDDGIDDESYQMLFKSIMGKVMVNLERKFPEAIVFGDEVKSKRIELLLLNGRVRCISLVVDDFVPNSLFESVHSETIDDRSESSHSKSKNDQPNKLGGIDKCVIERFEKEATDVEYWIIVATMAISERIGDAFISWFPMEIARNLMELRTAAGDIALMYWRKAASYGQTRIFDIFQFIVSQSTSSKSTPSAPQPQMQGSRVHQPTTAPPKQRSTSAVTIKPPQNEEQQSSSASNEPSSEHEKDAEGEVAPSQARPTAPSSSAQKPTPTPNDVLTETTKASSSSELVVRPSASPSAKLPAEKVEATLRLTRARLKKIQTAASGH